MFLISQGESILETSNTSQILFLEIRCAKIARSLPPAATANLQSIRHRRYDSFINLIAFSYKYSSAHPKEFFIHADSLLKR